MRHSLGLAALVLSAVVVMCSCDTVHIVPVNSTDSCQVEPCYTLDQFASEIRNRDFSHLTAYFLSGKHYLNQQLNMSQMQTVEMISASLNSEVHLNQKLSIISVQTSVINGLRFVSSNYTQWNMEIIECDTVFLMRTTFRKTTVRIRVMNITAITECAFINTTFRDYTEQSVVQVFSHYLNITDSEFTDNAVGTTLHVRVYQLRMVHCNFTNNYGGGLKFFNDDGSINIANCQFTTNCVTDYGGAIYIYRDSNAKVYISNSSFTNNTAQYGGAIYANSYGSINVTNCEFIGNHAQQRGGAVHIHGVWRFLKIGIRDSTFTDNTAKQGGAIQGVYIKLLAISNCVFASNQADNELSALTIKYSTLKLGRVTFEQNKGSIYLFYSRVGIIGPAKLSSNIGGAIHAVQSQIYINSTEGQVIISNNTATRGGGILLRGSELVIKSSIIISENRAETFGGGIYAYKSVIEVNSGNTEKKIFITNNVANQTGGGICSVASTIKLVKTIVTISFNIALHSGGGLYLQGSSKIHLFEPYIDFFDFFDFFYKIQFNITNNSAIYGGGIFIADNSTAEGLQCQGEKLKKKIFQPGCFIQTIVPADISYIFFDILIINNRAELGSALYGGLLDRCVISQQGEVEDTELNGLHFIRKYVMVSNGSVTSDPVRVVFCGKHNLSTVIKKKGEVFKINVSAIDQVGNPKHATIRSLVVTKSGVSRLKEGQAEQRVGDQCTELEYNVFSQESFALVELYADGPCGNLGISKQTFNIAFSPCTCPPGLEPTRSQIDCVCICDQELQLHHITNCSQEAGTIQLETNVWVGVANYTNGTGYIIHNCPFDYCVEKPVNISLNSSQEIDKQCAFNRSGLLCGECQEGLSLMLATSRCKECSNIYLLLLIPFALAGIALVGFILFFNLTIATGTIHSLIFYSNLLPVSYFTSPNALTVIISWVNLDLGIETCFYDGMSSQAKVLLQLVFPAYLFLLMFLIIILSRYSNYFATVLSNRNPVAALCTLIFMSYSKLLQFIIAALQSTVVEFPDNSSRRVWLYDTNVEYFTDSYAPRFIAAVLILVAGGLLTLQLCFAQWFPRCSDWRLMRWTRNTKYTGFMDTYHAPFTRKHRYWVGLLLFTLIVHNVIAAVATNDFLPVLSMGCIANGLIIVKLLNKSVYNARVNDILETTFLLNLVFLAYGTLYVQTSGTNTVILASISMGLSASLLLVIICYHSYKHVYLQSRFHRRHKTRITKMTTTVKESLRQGNKREETESGQREALETPYIALGPHCWREPDLDVLAPINTDDYEPAPPPCKDRPGVTYTIVEREPDTLTTDTQ